MIDHICVSRRIAEDDEQAQADGNCSSRFPRLFAFRPKTPIVWTRHISTTRHFCHRDAAKIADTVTSPLIPHLCPHASKFYSPVTSVGVFNKISERRKAQLKVF